MITGENCYILQHVIGENMSFCPSIDGFGIISVDMSGEKFVPIFTGVIQEGN